MSELITNNAFIFHISESYCADAVLSVPFRRPNYIMAFMHRDIVNLFPLFWL